MISEVLGEAFDVYKRLWLRSIVVAGLVFAVVALAEAFAFRSHSAAPPLVAIVLSLAGQLLVQGALVEVVRDLHESREPASIGVYYDRTRGRLGTLLGSSLLYGIGIAAGLFLFIVPGLIAIARWSLIVPLVMIEGRGARDAFARSSQLVKGQTGRVLVLVIITTLLTGLASLALHVPFSSLPPFASVWIGGTVAAAITTPYAAHVLTVLYYRLTEPERPVLPEGPPRETWRSVWDEEPPK
ncbi:MAG TPA: hypothetical protein VFA37_00200 [Gaiellaceae bacterium]|nr:hypothetical protein [Gaiellaceae bacterium]